MSEEASNSFTETVTESFSSATSSFAESATATATATADNEEFVAPTISISMKTPLLYLGVLIITLILFSIYHRKSKIKKLKLLTSSSLFNSSYNDIDESIINESSLLKSTTPTIDSTPALLYNDLKNLNAHEKLLKVALVERATESMRRIIKLKETEPSIMLLYTRGLIGDESFKRFKLQAKLQDAEMMEIAKEAETYKQGWSRFVFANAQEVMMNQALRRRVNAVNTRKDITENLEIKGVESVLSDIQKRIVELK